ncbi:MAG: adenine phosphoribosyltransferase [Trichodesmium sp. St15_bin1_1]|jgi:adenine phosphoribosyltransferase|nr:adenine phosphoribosyltransferase [Trichodesmium sp. MAG_R02]MDE5075666.1 adenine phosphoribosyltransferase [Trichodesmium sp. St5_bin2_1]MDE5090271.1 adenine phosphoribosyltransferase [Trichodesmium sp. St18_bin3_1_1]MDE5108314.1 adenine phosphoribosyltransferase [Trichodesmium sp. St17_bin3_1_1]MDE5112543.1 adenine phosphoribosyltransferase [Trichodesmium sp. St7_bin2_1]MDE5115239.1 adenine phosphoribosyltransferase [Trichodesmium sp. St15_bin1_1]MDE5118374.1 adenine phosphoribosyltransf
MELKNLIRAIPNFPKSGIIFRDITTLLSNPDGLHYTIDILTEKCSEFQPDYVAGIESRGFIFGVPLAYKLKVGFIPIRKTGKLPAPVHSVVYDLEYGQDSLDIHQDAMPPGSRVLVIDDLLATGGTAGATGKLIEKANCNLVGFGFVIELKDLGGRQKLPKVPIMSLIEY